MKEELVTLIGFVLRTVRASEWWNSKLVPIYSVFYATLYIQHVSVAFVWLTAIALLFAIAPCAAYVSLVNDLTDRKDDRCAGKMNRSEGKAAWQLAALFAVPLFAVIFFCNLWRDNFYLVGSYLGAWLVFSLYSIWPIRLKNRGVLGVLADACGAHVFPKLTAAFLAFRVSGNVIDPVWIAAIAIWAMGYGLRGILWHQFYDFDADHKASVQTFVVKHSHAAAMHLARFALLIEVAGLSVLLWRIQSVWPVIFLLVYSFYAILKLRVWRAQMVIAMPKATAYAILGLEYYLFLFPLALLISLATQNSTDWAVLIVHQIVFSQPAVSFIAECNLLLRHVYRQKGRRVE